MFSPTSEQNPDVFLVEAIIDKKNEKGVVKYLVKWKGYGTKDNTWEPQSNIFCDGLIKAYEEKQKTKLSKLPSKLRKRKRSLRKKEINSPKINNDKMSLRKRFKNSLAELNDEDLLEEDEELQVILATSKSLADIEKEIKEEIEYSDCIQPIKTNSLPEQSNKIFEITNDLVDTQSEIPIAINNVALSATSNLSGVLFKCKKVSHDSVVSSGNFLNLVDNISQNDLSNCKLSENLNAQKFSNGLNVASPQKKKIKLEKKSPNEQSPKSTNGFSPRKATSRDNINDEYRKLYGSPHILNLSTGVRANRPTQMFTDMPVVINGERKVLHFVEEVCWDPPIDLTLEEN